MSAPADRGALRLCIPEHLGIQLSLVELERRDVVLPDGHRRTVPYVGPVEDMDRVLRPQLQSVDVNPESPTIPLSVAK